eukprot:m.926388 g.926388  ORF g.926388 m.926388 type:complete len:111 (+) comp139359_c0_seq1:51-383(+)
MDGATLRVSDPTSGDKSDTSSVEEVVRVLSVGANSVFESEVSEEDVAGSLVNYAELARLARHRRTHAEPAHPPVPTDSRGLRAAWSSPRVLLLSVIVFLLSVVVLVFVRR